MMGYEITLTFISAIPVIRITDEKLKVSLSPDRIIDTELSNIESSLKKIEKGEYDRTSILFIFTFNRGEGDIRWTSDSKQFVIWTGGLWIEIPNESNADVIKVVRELIEIKKVGHQ